MDKYFRFEVRKSDILSKIYLISGYIAGKQGGDYVNFDRISAIEDDKEFLGEIVDVVSAELGASMGFRLAGYVVTGDIYQYVLKIRSDAGVVAAMSCGYIASETLRRWLSAVGETKGAEFLKPESESKLAMLMDYISSCEASGRVASCRSISPI